MDETTNTRISKILTMEYDELLFIKNAAGISYERLKVASGRKSGSSFRFVDRTNSVSVSQISLLIKIMPLKLIEEYRKVWRMKKAWQEGLLK